MAAPRAPSHLPDEGKKLWREVQRLYEVSDPTGLALLETAAICFGRMKQLEAEVGDNLVVQDRFGQDRQHPSLAVIKDYRNGFMTAIKALELSLDEFDSVIGAR